MSKYGSVAYGQPTYGQRSRLAFSIEPFVATAISYSSILVEFSAPVGGYTAFRIVRNQEGYSQTAEDGAIIYEEFGISGSDGTVGISSLTDSSFEIPGAPALIPGKFVYYRAWILKSSDNVWYPAGNAYTLLPSPHPTYGPDKSTLMTTHDKIMDLIPRTFTSVTQSPIDAVNQDSDLYRFFKGISFTFDEFLTMTDSLMPNYRGDKTSPLIINVQADDLGLTREPSLSLKHQKAMVREALYIYSRKGTIAGLQTLVESVSGYDADISESLNLMLSNEDSTFAGGLGNWLPIGTCTLSVEDTEPVTSESLTIDRVYSAKVVVSAAGAKISNGEDYPVTRGVPVVSGFTYKYSFYIRKSTGTANVTPTIYWYDFKGALISSDEGTSSGVTGTWSEITTEATAPSEAVYAAIDILFESSGTYYVDMVQVATSGVLTFNEARSINIFLNPTKTNFLPNPSFEVDNSAWEVTVGSGTYETATIPVQMLVGTKVLELAPGETEVTTVTAADEVTSGGFYSLSVYGKTSDLSDVLGISITATTSAQVSAYELTDDVATLTLPAGHPVKEGDTILVADVDAAFDGEFTVTSVVDTLISYAVTSTDVELTAATGTVTVSTQQLGTTTLSEDWSRGELSFYLPSTYVSPSTFFTVSFGGTFTGTVQLDGAQLEKGYRASDYFDGSYGTERDAVWAGATNDSSSYLYPNKIDNVSRLAFEVPKFIPYDTPWIISSHSGTEASGIS